MIVVEDTAKGGKMDCVQAELTYFYDCYLLAFHFAPFLSFSSYVQSSVIFLDFFLNLFYR